MNNEDLIINFKFRGIDYIIFKGNKNHIGNYCAYVKLPEKHPYQKFMAKKSCIDLTISTWKLKKANAKKVGESFNEPRPKSHRRYFDDGYSLMDIDCHGGLSFSRIIKEGEKGWPQKLTPGSWIGWDYGHAGDYVEGLDVMLTNRLGGYRWTINEIDKECHYVINQLLKIKRARFYKGKKLREKRFLRLMKGIFSLKTNERKTNTTDNQAHG